MALKRALTLKNVLDAKVRKFDFTGEWRDAFGTPERTGVWNVFGGSGSGKTSFVLLLMKHLADFGKVLFVSYEEGKYSANIQDGIVRFGMLSTKNNILVCVDSREELEERLARANSPDIIVIDSLELSEFTTIKQVKEFSDRFPRKLFIFVGQAEGDKPRTELGKSVLFFAKQKIYVNGYRAFSRGRSFGAVGHFDIWKSEAERFHEYK
jgi:hypothetical protein